MVQDKGLNRGGMEVAATAGVVGFRVVAVGAEGAVMICGGGCLLSNLGLHRSCLNLEIKEAVGQGQRAAAQYQKNADNGNDTGGAKTGNELGPLVSH